MKIVDVKFYKKSFELNSGLICVAELYRSFNVLEDTERLYLVRIDAPDIPLSPEEFMGIRGGEKFELREIDESFNERKSTVGVRFNDNPLPLELNHSKIRGRDLRRYELDFKNSCLYLAGDEEVDYLIEDEWTLVVQTADRFFSFPGTIDEPIEIKECSIYGRIPPRGKHRYRITIDGEIHVVNKFEITGEEILDIVGKNYGEWSLNLKLHGGRRVSISADEIVDLCGRGIERFETVKKQAQQGEFSVLRREDEDYLNTTYPERWEQLNENEKYGIVIRQFKLVSGYTPCKVDMMLLIPNNYPMAGIDMFYFHPEVKRDDKCSIPALVQENHFNRNWQRWSRHYDWDPNCHEVATHIALIIETLKSEL